MTSSGGLREIVVRGLFGLRDYKISMDAERPTILTGANGTGKSTILRLVNAVSSADIRTLVAAPVDLFELNFESIPRFRLTRAKRGAGIKIQWGDHSSDIGISDELGEFPDWVVRAVLQTPSTSESLDHYLIEQANAAGIGYREFQETRDAARKAEGWWEAPDWLNNISEQFPVLFVTDQRLVVDSEMQARDPRKTRTTALFQQSRQLAVEAASADIASQMQRADSAYARASQLQDRHFPSDVIKAMRRQQEVAPLDVMDLLKEVDTRREKLRRVGLLDTDQDIEPDLAAESVEDGSIRPVMAAFLRSNLRKLEVLEDLSARLSLFKDFMDARFSTKIMVLSRRDGLRFTVPSGESIRASQLSSGEQQMLVLVYEILFRAKEGTLVIVDEPEISLHVLWQDTLVEDLLNMGGPGHLQFLMATHSPVLLAAHPELERSLDMSDNDS